MGELRYVDVAPMLEDLIDEVKDLRNRSTLPEECSREFWESWLVYNFDERFRSYERV